MKERNLRKFYLVCLDYEEHEKNFRQMSTNSNHPSRNSIAKTSTKSMDLSVDASGKKQPKLDKMKHANQVFENDENSQPSVTNISKTTEKKKSTLHR